MSNSWDLDKILRLAGLPAQETQPLNESYEDFDDEDTDEDPDVRIASSDKRQAQFEKKNKKSIKTAEKEADTLKKKPAAKKAEAPAEKKAEEKKPAEKAPAKKAEKKGDDTTFVHGKGFVKKEEADKKEAPKSEEKKPAPKAEEKKPEAAKPEAAKPEEKKPEPKAEEPKAEEKKEEAAAKKRGKAPNDNSKEGQARAWLKAHASMPRNERRKAFIKHFSSENSAKWDTPWSKARASAAYAKYSPRSAEEAKQEVKELWALVHPFMPSFMLAENREMNQMQWVDPLGDLEPMFFHTEAEAQKIAKYMAEWKGQQSVLDKFIFEDDKE